MTFYPRHTKTPQQVYPAYQEHVIAVTNTYLNPSNQVYVYPNGWVTANNPKHTLEITVEGTVVAKLIKPIDADGYTRFHVQEILQDFVSADTTDYVASATDNDRISIHKIPKYSRNNNNLKSFSVKAGLEYTSSVTGNLVTQQTSMQFSGSQYYNQTYFVWNGCKQHRDGLLLDMSDFLVDDADTKILSDFPGGYSNTDTASRQKIRQSDYHTVAFFMGVSKPHLNGSTTSSRINHIRFTTFNADGTGNTSFVHNNIDSQGGVSGTPNFDSDKSLIYRGVGVQNVIDAGLVTASAFPVGGYYAVQFEDSSNNEVRQRLVFDIVGDDCRGYETIRLAWLNSLGAYDYYNFTKLSVRTTSSKRTNFVQDYGYNQDNAFYAYDYGTHQGGTQTYHNLVTQEIECNTDYIDETTAAVLENLFTSPLVQMQNSSGDWENVVVSEREYTKQTSSNDKLIQYSFSVEYSHKKTVQRL